MIRKVLVPLDGSPEAEKVLDLLRADGRAYTEVILLHVVPPGSKRTVGTQVPDATEEGGADAEVVLFEAIPPERKRVVGTQVLDTLQEEQSERDEALNYLHRALERQGGTAARWRCEVAVHHSIAEAILECALREGVDVIAMYTHDRKGLARLLRGSIAQDVKRKAPLEVLVYKPKELASAA